MIDNKEKLLTLIVAIIITTIQVIVCIGVIIVFNWSITYIIGYTTNIDWTIVFLSCWVFNLLFHWYEDLRIGK